MSLRDATTGATDAENRRPELAALLESIGQMRVALIDLQPQPVRMRTFALDVGVASGAQGFVDTFHLDDTAQIRSAFLSNHASNANTVTLYAGGSPSGRVIFSVVGGAWKRYPVPDGTSSVTLFVPQAVGTGNVTLMISSARWSPTEGTAQ